MLQRPLSSHQRVPFVCFACPTSVKLPLPAYSYEVGSHLWGETKCPRCQKPMVFLGRYFKVPPQRAMKQWRKTALLYTKGWKADGYSSGPQSLREAREVPAVAMIQGARCRAVIQYNTEERWRRLRLQREHLKRHKDSQD